MKTNDYCWLLANLKRYLLKQKSNYLLLFFHNFFFSITYLTQISEYIFEEM